MTAKRAYLDRGRLDGLAAGASIQLERRGRAVGTCRIEAIADHHAVCVGDGVLPGDRFRLPPPAPPAPATAGAGNGAGSPSVAPAAGSAGHRTGAASAGTASPGGARTTAPISSSDLAQRRSTLLAAPIVPVPFSGSAAAASSPALRLKSEVGLSNLTYVAFGDSARPFNGEVVDVFLRGPEIGSGVRLYVDMTAVQWTSRPTDAQYRNGVNSMLFVREAAVAARDVGLPYTVAAGRIRPWALPGFYALDGAQAAYRSAAGDVEAGVFGGALPDLLALSPRGYYATGAYYALDSAASGAPRWLHHEARVSLLSGPGAGQFFEGEALAQGVLGPVDGGADLQMVLSGPSGAALNGARFDFGARPLEGLRLMGGYRYANGTDPTLALIHGAQYATGRGHHGDAMARYDVSSYFGLGLLGGFARDLDLAMNRSFVGPEVYLPRLLGDRAGLSLGYQEEFGWAAGRTAYVQAIGIPFGIRVLARLSYFDESSVNGGGADQDVGLYLSGQAPIWKWLSFRGSALTRFSISGLSSSATMAGTMLNLGLRGEF